MMSKFYPAICFLSIAVLIFLSCTPLQHTELKVISAPFLTEEIHVKVKKHKVYISKKPGIFGAFITPYFHTIALHFYRGCFCSFFFFCIGQWTLALPAGASVFALSSVATLLQIAACYFKWKVIGKISYWYGIVFSSCYETVFGLLFFSVCAAVIKEMAVIIWVLQEEILEACGSIFLFAGLVGSLQITPKEGPFSEVLNTGDGLKIEVNELFYRITMGPLNWMVKKTDTWNRVIFAVLIYSAGHCSGKRHIVNKQDLARALGWSHFSFIDRFHQLYRSAGYNLVALMPHGIDIQLGEIKRRALILWREDLNLSIEDIECKLRQEGIEATKEQIELALRYVNFNKLRNYLQRNYDRKRYAGAPALIDVQLGRIKSRALILWREDLNLSIEDIECKLRQEGIETNKEQIEMALRQVDFNKLRNYLQLNYVRKCSCREAVPVVRMEFLQKCYRIWLGEFSWEVCASRKAELMSLFDWLEQSRRIDGRPVISPKHLRDMREQAREHLFEKLLKYEITARQRHPLDHCAQRYQLTEKIIQLWLENITLSGEKIASILVEQGDVEAISPVTVYNLVEQVDFMKIRKQLLKDYRQGKYRKSTRWVMQKYRDIIDDLLKQLAQGQQWSKAQIEKYIEDMPAPLHSPEKEMYATKAYFTRAWLKCFLFNLPKSKNGAICCRECGSFDTIRKTKAPCPHIVTDPKTGQTVTVYTFRFCCKNPQCSVTTFSATDDGSHILHEDRYAKACTMLRLVMDLGGSYRSVGRIMGLPKSVVFDHLTLIADMTDYWREILGTPRFSGTLCIDEKFVKIAELKPSKGNRNFAYLFFAVDPVTYDLLHIEIYPSRDKEAVVAFLTAIKAQGIFPKTIMTDLFAGYDSAIKEVYGRSVTIAKCHFHFQKNIFKHIHDQFGKKNVPEIAKMLQKDIFFVVGAKSKKTIRDRYRDLQQLRGEYLRREPKLLPMFDCLDSYLPHLLRVIEHENVEIQTNNACELTIRRFEQRYKTMGCFESLSTAQRHAKLFQIYHRFTPFTQDAEPRKRGKAPLQLAGYDIGDMPIYQYLTQPLLLNLQPARNLALCQERSA